MFKDKSILEILKNAGENVIIKIHCIGFGTEI